MDESKKRLVSVLCPTLFALGCAGYFTFSRDTGAQPDRAPDGDVNERRTRDLVEPDAPERPRIRPDRTPPKPRPTVGNGKREREPRRNPRNPRRDGGRRKPVRIVKTEQRPAG